MDSPDDWRWVWIVATAVFAVGEMTSPGSFFLAPFAVGAFVAALLAFANVSVVVEWIVFVVVSIATLLALRPLARRLDRDAVDHGVGSRRLAGTRATVLRAIPGGDDVGMVRVDREEWRAQSTDGTPIPTGATVRVAEVQGTRLLVAVEALPPADGSGPSALPGAGAAEPPPPPGPTAAEPRPPAPPGPGLTAPEAAAPRVPPPEADSP
jgi:membrane protein implicated in regulation of membrane protease activity